MADTDENIVDIFKVNGVRLIEFDGGAAEFVILEKGEENAPHPLLEAFKDALSQALGYHAVNSMGNRFNVQLLMKYWPGVKSEVEEYGVAVPDELEKHIEARIKKRREQLQSSIERGEIEFDDLPVLFEEGMEVVANFAGHEVGGIVVSTEMKASFFGNYCNVSFKVFNNVYGNVADGPMTVPIGAYRGVRKIASLAVRRATEEDKVTLAKRGGMFRKVAGAASYVQYQGQITQNSWYGSRSYRADGRVMVDISTFMKTQSDTYHSESRASGVVNGGRDEHAPSVEIPDDGLWRCHPFVYGFSFSAKQWGRLEVSGLSEIQWRDDAWDKLVLDDQEKELVKALVEFHGESFSDIVDEKGGGIIFLLHGPPGEGKTLTMETIAELLHKPLYRVSVGELGINPDQLEDRLREILDIATIWDAVVGLDEADIFLAQRDKDNILRNAMVGVFLRLTEYHQGVLFLTTNLVEQIDEAFESRISVSIGFQKGTTDKRKKIWTNLLKAAQVKDGLLDIDALSLIELNGRQIKNVIRLSQTLAKARSVELSVDIVNQVVSVTQRKRD